MKAKHFVWGSLLLLVVFLFVGHQAILHEPPQSIHKWRQSDSASWAWNYYHGSANLFKPQFNNLANEQKAASEFPIVYWLVGMFYRLFSPHHAWFRGLQLLIVFSGFWALYRWAMLMLTDQTWSILYALLIASSPLLHFYANGFIPDPLAFAACAWGWYGFFRYRATPQAHVLTLSLLSFGLAALFKVSFIGSLGAAALLLIWRTPLRTTEAKVNPWYWQQVCLIVGVGGLIVAWYLYASWYTTGFDREHFSTIVRPWTSLNLEESRLIWDDLRAFHLPYLYHPLCGTFLLLLSISPLLWLKQSRRDWWFLSGMIGISLLLYLYCFYWLMGVHEYYLLAFLPLIAMGGLHGLQGLQERWPRIMASPILKVLVLALVIFGLYRAKTELRMRYFGRTMNYKEHPAFYHSELQSFLLQLGITPDTRVISVPDYSPNNTLYLLQRTGWSNANFTLQEPQKMNDWIKTDGAEFLIISDTSLWREANWAPYFRYPKGEFEGLYVYGLGEDVPRETSD